jgi:hypothetical protein
MKSENVYVYKHTYAHMCKRNMAHPASERKHQKKIEKNTKPNRNIHTF